MERIAMSLLAAWNGFYVVTGTAAAALTGLQFIVIVLGAQAGVGAEGAVSAFGTPTIVHFCTVLLFSALLTAPWPSLLAAALALGVFAFAGFAYSLAVLRRARLQKDYVLVLEDWIWHGGLPILGYAALVGAAIALPFASVTALFVVGAASLVLLFVGIHNAWDGVTYIALQRVNRTDRPDA